MSAVRGFSLIEVIGALAVIAVLAAILFPVMIRRIDLATRKQESTNLLVVSNALALHAVHNSAVPTVEEWTNSVAAWSPVSAPKAVANSRRYPRFYFTPASASAATNGVASRPTSARAVLVSMLGGDTLDTSTFSDPRGGALSDAEFDFLWNTPDASLPAGGMLASWNGRGDDLLIQRIDYAPLFYRLVLVNRDTNNNASFRINGGAANPLVYAGPPNLGWEAYYLQGTAVSLCNGAGVPATRLVLSRDMGFVFEANMWRDQIMGMGFADSQPDDFAAKAKVFLEAEWNTNARQGGANTADQQTVLSAMYSFMYTYTLWANQRPHFPYHGAPQQQVPEFEMLQDVADDNKFLDVFTRLLVGD
jgi:prepilin-type N-terminal cleavage/methylation domain-containing protein